MERAEHPPGTSLSCSKSPKIRCDCQPHCWFLSVEAQNGAGSGNSEAFWLFRHRLGVAVVAPIEKTVVCITRVGWDIVILELSHHHCFPAQFKVLTAPGVAGILLRQRSPLSPSHTVVIIIWQMNLSSPGAEIPVTDRRSYLEAPLFWNGLILEVCQCHSLAKQRDQNYPWLFTQACELLHHHCRMLQAFEFKGQLFTVVLVLFSIIST